MRVRIVKLHQTQSGVLTLSFESPLGEATAEWIGEAPAPGLEYDVELDVPDVLAWGTDVSATSRRESIYEKDDKVFLVGRVESLSDDGVVAIKLGEDIVLIEVTNAPLEIPIYVEIRAPQIKLFDIRM